MNGFLNRLFSSRSDAGRRTVERDSRALNVLADVLTQEQIAKVCSTQRDRQKRPYHIVRSEIRRTDGRREVTLSKNSRVNAGASAVAQLIGSAAGTPFKYVALSPTSITAAAGDTALSGETSATGLTRAAATYGGYTAPSSLNGTATYTLSVSFTNTSGATVTINSIGCFNASSAGTMLAEAVLSAAQVLNNGDTMNLVWTFTV